MALGNLHEWIHVAVHAEKYSKMETEHSQERFSCLRPPAESITCREPINYQWLAKPANELHHVAVYDGT
jgi:hypothetical protein